MKKRFCILIEDDWELMGNGSGNVASHQYLPALFLMNLARKLNLKLTFMVDVAQQLTFNRYQHEDSRIRIQKELWDATVRLMKENGFDVQLHLHPQWVAATHAGGRFRVSGSWNLALYDPSFQEDLLQNSIEYLHSLLRDIDPAYQVHSFKAGSWALQPFEKLSCQLCRFNIRIILGVRRGLKIPNVKIDYSQLEEDTLPYYPCDNDVTRVAPGRSNLILLPLAYYAPDPGTLMRLTADVARKRITNRRSGNETNEPPKAESSEVQSPIEERSRFHLSLRPYLTHLKIGDQPFSYLKSSFDAVINRLRQSPVERLPIVIESHTKQYLKNYLDVEKFLVYITKKYEEEVEFSDLTSFLNDVDNNSQYVRSGDVSRSG